MKKSIIKYFKLKMQCKISLKKEIERINATLERIEEVQKVQEYLIQELSKESYKTKYKEEHKKYKELLKKQKEVK